LSDLSGDALNDPPTTTITYWPNGYADSFGMTMVCVPGHLTRDEADRLVRCKPNGRFDPMRSFARVVSVQHYPKPPVQPISEAYRLAMQGDNS